MPSYLHPGVYVEEIPSGARPIEGVATSTAAFVGVTQRNSRQSDPVLIGNMNDYLDLFGPILTSSDAMGLAVQAFYQNGGKAAYICSLSTDSDTATRDFGDLTVDAKGDGPWGNHLYIRITRVGADDFDMEVGARNEDGTFYTLESAYEKLSLDPTDDMYAEGVVNEASSLIEVSVGGVTLPTVTDNDGDGDGNDDGLALEHGEQTAPSNTDYSTFYEETLRKYRDVSIIVLPGENWAADGSGNPIIDATRSHCEKEKNRVVILDPPSTLELKTSNTVSDMSLPTSTYTVLYYPWVGMSNPLYHRDRNPNAAATVNVAPSAIAAGMWAKIDGKRGVWKAPAGVETQLTGASSLAFKVDNLEQDQLNPVGVNCIRNLPGYGTVIWGARTLATKADPEWRYVPVRRTAIFIEESIYQNIQWAVFEPNDAPLWSSLRANIGAFMNGLFRAGAFQGQKASDAYFVRCGLGDTMTQGDIDRGQVIVLVGFAPLKPAEFVIVRIQQKVGEE
ncbi:phage tail sheath family protein [Desulfobacter curvatus]|uniref:phage tail sheath family protein n=1 Tax=Desulfobacter curvatus TaxID=2290 RepID=UPI000372D843|nr:phage tail sheath subtilisin-like domain-containing protein [Desulfobacter curvatus]